MPFCVSIVPIEPIISLISAVDAVDRVKVAQLFTACGGNYVGNRGFTHARGPVKYKVGYIFESIMRRSTFPGAKSCFCPATSSIVFGLNLSANGEFIFFYLP